MPLPEPGEESLVRGEAFAVDQIVERIQARGAIASFVVLDACRNNPFKTKGVRSIGSTRGLRDVSAPKGVFVLFSAGIGQTALDRLSDDDSNPNSVFTRNLVPLLKQPGLSHVQLAKQVQSDVDKLARTVRHDQQPAYYDQVIGNMFLVNGKANINPVIQTSKASPSTNVEQARDIYNDIKNSGDISILEIFAKQYPNSIYAKFARRKIETLRGKIQRPLNVASLDTTTREFRQSDRLLNECDRLAAQQKDQGNKTGNEVSLFKLEKHSESAISACQPAMVQYPDDGQTLFQLGRSYQAAKLYNRAVKQYRLAMNVGYQSGTYNLARMYNFGRGVPINYKKAAGLYKIASDKGHFYATNSLASLYGSGKGVTKDSKKAVRLYKIASDKGVPVARYNLAYSYYTGIGVTRDNKRAASLIFELFRSNYRYAVGTMTSKHNTWNKQFRRELQRKMKQEGYYNGAINGNLDFATITAIKRVAGQ